MGPASSPFLCLRETRAPPPSRRAVLLPASSWPRPAASASGSGLLRGQDGRVGQGNGAGVTAATCASREPGVRRGTRPSVTGHGLSRRGRGSGPLLSSFGWKQTTGLCPGCPAGLDDGGFGRELAFHQAVRSHRARTGLRGDPAVGAGGRGRHADTGVQTHSGLVLRQTQQTQQRTTDFYPLRTQTRRS